jgi:hypothetical protein
MIEQLEMFEIPYYHYYEMERHGKMIKGWVIPYSKTSAWSGAWYVQETKAFRFAEYSNSRKEK